MVKKMTQRITEYFGCNVFSDQVMESVLPRDIYKSIRHSIDQGLALDPGISDVVADAMKEWALDQGATHFTHWFQPMTNITAGKHDSFLEVDRAGNVILNFSGKSLIKGEPDASSFPNGGLRNTFEARGYTAWDCTSPAFVRDGTLFIPTAFYAYTGQALDLKTPLLRSISALSSAGVRLLRAIGNTSVKKVLPTVGAEQEYFLIDRAMYEKRLDLKICGRTLFGARPPKGQEMDDHYCGRIRLRVAEFMRQLDEELWKLGVLSKTKHNEAAPAQHELAPIFSMSNIATDHNQLTMEMMRIVAKKNDLVCLLHEKPFAFVNGSGKHNNWSVSTDSGINLLEPGKTPHENMQFLLIIAAVITAVDKHADLVRLSAASAGNDHRLGGNEAPPAIISIALGTALTDMLTRLADADDPISVEAKRLEVGVATLPPFYLDDSDRNRTSPFAFTGNKFEFRMVGSSASIAAANFVLNSIVADVFCEFAEKLEKEPSENKNHAMVEIIQNAVKLHGRVIFNGNNYGETWVEEAEKRGLPNLKNTVEAADAWLNPDNIALFERQQVFSKEECESRHEILLETYCKVITIEADTMIEMVARQLLPATILFAGKIAKSVNDMADAGALNQTAVTLLNNLSIGIDNISICAEALKIQLAAAAQMADRTACAEHLCGHVLPKMEELRKTVDYVETKVSDKSWPVPTYTDLLYRI